MTRKPPRSGLVLLIVLGMLALLSLVTVTYLVFSTESRRASMQLARGDYRGTPADKIMDQAVRQVIRGTKDTHSPLWLNDILGDLYGESTDEPFQVHEARATTTPIARDNPTRVVQLGYSMPPGMTTYDSGSPESQDCMGPFAEDTNCLPVASNPTYVRLLRTTRCVDRRVLTFMQGPLRDRVSASCGTWEKLKLFRAFLM